MDIDAARNALYRNAATLEARAALKSGWGGAGIDPDGVTRMVRRLLHDGQPRAAAWQLRSYRQMYVDAVYPVPAWMWRLIREFEDVTSTRLKRGVEAYDPTEGGREPEDLGPRFK